MKNENKNALCVIATGITLIVFVVTLLASVGQSTDEHMKMTAAAAHELCYDNTSGCGCVFGIMYHQVLKDESRHGKYVISPEELESDLKFLGENGFKTLLPSEVCAFRDSGTPLPEKTAVISFDDGYETGLEYVLPLLRKYGMKAAVNIVGSYTDEYTALPANEKNLSFAYLTWDEVQALSDSGIVEIGNHTYDMHSCGAERYGCAIKRGEDEAHYRSALTEDIGRLQEKLAEHTGRAAQVFAFPFGAISSGAYEAIEAVGIKVFLTCNEAPSVINGSTVVINRYNREHGRSVRELYALYSEQCGA